MSLRYLMPVTQTQKRMVLLESNLDSLELFDMCISSIDENCNTVEFFDESFYAVRKYFSEGIDLMIKKINEMIDQLMLLFDRCISDHRFIMKKYKELIFELAKSPYAAKSEERLTIYDMHTYNSFPNKPNVEAYKLILDDTIIDSYLRQSENLEFLFSNNINKLIREMYGSGVPLQVCDMEDFDMEKFKEDIRSFTFKTHPETIGSTNVIDCINFMEDYSALRKEIKTQRNTCVGAMYKLRDGIEGTISVLDTEKIKAFSRKNISEPHIRNTKEYANLVRDLENYYTSLANIIYQSHTIKFKGYTKVLKTYKENINILIKETRLLYKHK